MYIEEILSLTSLRQQPVANRGLQMIRPCIESASRARPPCVTQRKRIYLQEWCTGAQRNICSDLEDPPLVLIKHATVLKGIGCINFPESGVTKAVYRFGIHRHFVKGGRRRRATRIHHFRAKTCCRNQH